MRDIGHYNYGPEPPDPPISYGEWLWEEGYSRGYLNALCRRAARRFGWDGWRTRREFVENWNERTPK